MDNPALHPPTPKRKPGPRLAILPIGTNPYASGPGSSSDDAESSGHNSAASTSRSSHALYPAHTSSQPSSKPKLSLFGVPRTNNQLLASSSSSSSGMSSREDLVVAPGFENMSLEDKTMTPYMMQQQQQQQLQQPSRPSSSSSVGGVKSRPKLALGSISPSPSPYLNAASTSSAAAASEGMSRSTSFEGALIAETSHVNVDGDDYKLCPDTLQDLGRLGEGASGEVRKVLHKPSSLVMAKKVISTFP